MRNYEPVLYSGIIMVILTFFLMDRSASPARQAPHELLEGTLYSSDDVSASTPVAGIPVKSVPVFMDDPTRLGLPAGTVTFMAQLVAQKDAAYRLCSVIPPGRKPPQVANKTSDTPAKIRLDKPPRLVHERSRSSGAYSYDFMDHLLAAEDSIFALNDHRRREDFTWQLEKLGKWDDLYLLKFSFSNDGAKEFFLGPLTIQAGDQPVVCGIYMPLSCRPGEEIHGIAAFPIDAVKGKKVAASLYQTGQEKSFMTIQRISYDF